jgi:phosphoserine phosphatase
VIAVGDGANDIAMLQLAGLGVAFHGKPAVRAAADVRIDHADLSALLYLQGYRQDEFVS